MLLRTPWWRRLYADVLRMLLRTPWWRCLYAGVLRPHDDAIVLLFPVLDVAILLGESEASGGQSPRVKSPWKHRLGFSFSLIIF